MAALIIPSTLLLLPFRSSSLATPGRSELPRGAGSSTLSGSGLINPLGEPLCRSLLGLLPGQEGTPQGSRLINPLGELLRPSPPLGYHHPSLAGHLQWVEMFSAQQKVLPLVGRGRGTGT